MSANYSAKLPKPSLKERILRTASLAGWVFLVFIIVQIAVVAGVNGLGKLGLKFGDLDNTVFVFSLSVVIYALVLAITIAVPVRLKLWSGDLNIKKLLGINLPFRFRDIAFVAIAFVIYLALVFWVMQLVGLLFPSVNLNQAQDLGIKSLSNNFEFILALLTFVVLAPLAEELLFRGYLFGNLRRILPFSAAAIITSALFGLVHFQWNVSIDVFVLSLVLCYLRENTHRLWPSIMLHMGKNFLAFASLFIFHLT